MGKGATGQNPTLVGKIVRKTVGKVIDTGKIGVRGKSTMTKDAKKRSKERKYFNKLSPKEQQQFLRLGYDRYRASLKV